MTVAVVDRAVAEAGAWRAEALMRPPSVLMRPERLAVIQPSRVSAARSLMVDATRQRWRITCTRFEIDERARGVACYSIDTGSWRFSFPVYSFEPSSAGRTGRIIGRAWDMMGALIDGDLSQRDFETTQRELPKLYEGRATSGTLTWCRSNRSGRLFNFAVDSLAAGRQPDVAELARTCYLMRNTGIDGNGTFGTKTFLAYEDHHPLRRSLAAQMLSAYMMRVFAGDLIRHLAHAKGGSRAAEMAPEISRFLGVGNGSALGLMFFVNNHPRLIDRWLRIREQTLAEAKLVAVHRDAAPLTMLDGLLEKAIVFRRQDRAEYEKFTPSAVVADDLAVVRRELSRLIERVREGVEPSTQPLIEFTASLDGRVSNEALETLHSLMIELVPEIADQLVRTLVIDEELVGRPEMAVGRLRDIIRSDYSWAFDLDLVSDRSRRYIWYKSVTAEEPRRGPREEVGEAHNLGLDLPRLIVALDRDLAMTDGRQSIARFLMAHPQHRRIATRVQALTGLPYHSPHGDIMSEDFVPAHITRLLNVGIHGIDKTRDFLDRNLRGVLFHGAPTAADLASGNTEPHWFYPAEPQL